MQMRPAFCSSLALLLTVAPSFDASAAVGVTLSAGSSPVARVAPGAVFALPLILDMTAAAPGMNVAAISADVSWSVSRLTLDSLKSGPFGTLVASTGGATAGSATFSATSVSGAASTVTVATLFFTAAATNGSTQVVLAPTAASNAAGVPLLDQVAPRNVDVGVAPVGNWGDANGDDAVNIIDAQQIARLSVGLGVANPAATAARGDVTGDATVNIVDAQQVARFGVGLPAAARVNTPLYTAPSVASIALAPLTPTVMVGAGVQLTATPKDATGASLAGFTTVSWTSSNEAIATVNASGFVTGMSAGAAAVTATAGGHSSQVTVTVASGPAGPVVAECAAPKAGWIWCDDFETDRLASYFEYVNVAGRFVRESGAGVAGSMGMSARYQVAAQAGPGQLHLAFGQTPDPYFRPVDAGTAKYREIYWRVYIKHPTSWVGGGPDKMSRAISFASNTWAEAMIAHVWDGTPGNDQLVIDPASGTDVAGTLKTTGYNDNANLRWLGAAQSTTNLFNAANLGTWKCIEAHVRLNDAGQSNGVFDLWINDALEANRSGLNWVGAYSAYGINALFFENYWNDGSPVEQTRYWDNIVVSTQRIGC